MLSEGPTAAEARVLQAHSEYLESLAAAGHLELAGRTQTTDPSTFGIVIFHAADLDAARGVMEADPGVAGGVMSGELFPYRVAFRRAQPDADRGV